MMTVFRGEATLETDQEECEVDEISYKLYRRLNKQSAASHIGCHIPVVVDNRRRSENSLRLRRLGRRNCSRTDT